MPPADNQHELFPEDPALIGGYIHVVFNRPLTTLFTYSVSKEILPHIALGKRVSCPFGKGNKTATGYCVGFVQDKPDRKVKGIYEVLDDEPLLVPGQLKLTKWMADYYCCGWGQVLDAMVPAGAKAGAGLKKRFFVTLVPEAERPLVEVPLSKKQEKVLHLLSEESEPREAHSLAAQAKCGITVIGNLVRKGYLTRFLQTVETKFPVTQPGPNETPLALNEEQASVLAQITTKLVAGGFHTFLLHGVTGSGKTEVYLQAIDHVIRRGQQALVLVPEISLTPQAVQRFTARFGSVSVLHSHLANAERAGSWRQIAQGLVPVVIGARSAIFAPTPKLGLIVVDEEHETSFKQESTPRYHARDVAVMRGRMEDVPVLLGSATPSLESWYNAQQGRYTLLSLPHRVGGQPMPPVGLIDLRYEPKRKGAYRAIGQSLQFAMQKALSHGGQVILLLNRRGFDTCLFCSKCGLTVKCKFCDVAMIHHVAGFRHPDFIDSDPLSGGETDPTRQERKRQAQGKGFIVCHYCGYQQRPMLQCSDCQSDLKYLGLGTEKLELELADKFPNIPAARMDADAMKRAGSHKKIFDAFQNGEIKILFGTQMIAKGLDVPKVTLVGVIHADMALNVPDFRSGERTFQLLAQVAGRAGRGPMGGKVLVQCYEPNHPSIQYASKHDYLGFVAAELVHRQQHQFPPYNRLARVVLRGKIDEEVKNHARVLAEAIRLEGGTRLALRGPVEAPLKKLESYYRWHFLIHSGNSSTIREVWQTVRKNLKDPSAVEVTMDIDPFGLL